MIKCVFKMRDGSFYGFRISGHEENFDGEFGMVCSAVSSATMLTCNAVTDFFDADARVTVENNCITLVLKKSNKAAQSMLGAFYAHLDMLSQDTDELIIRVID